MKTPRLLLSKIMAPYKGFPGLVNKSKNARWNRVFSLSSDVVALLAERGLAVNIDAYFDGPESDEEV